MRDLIMRLSTKEDEIKKLRQDKENLDKECLKHSKKLAELEVLNEKNRETEKLRSGSYSINVGNLRRRKRLWTMMMIPLNWNN